MLGASLGRPLLGANALRVRLVEVTSARRMENHQEVVPSGVTKGKGNSAKNFYVKYSWQVHGRVDTCFQCHKEDGSLVWEGDMAFFLPEIVNKSLESNKEPLVSEGNEELEEELGNKELEEELGNKELEEELGNEELEEELTEELDNEELEEL